MRKRQIKLWEVFAGWNLLALFFASQFLIENVYSKRPFAWWRILCLTLVFFYLWLALIPIALWLNKRFPIRREKIFKSLLVHIPASLLLSLTHLAIYASIYPLIVQPLDTETNSFGVQYPNLLINFFHFGLLFYWGVLFIKYAIDYYWKYQERALRESQLEVSLAQSQIQLLKMQLQPHFLFNTLNTISELVHEDAEAADRMIARLSNLLRVSLENAGAQEVSLKEELEFLGKYLAIEQIRYGERLAVYFDVNPDVLDATVPNMILQPLVENAVRYAISPRAAGGSIEINARRENDLLCIRVRDDGQSLGKSEQIDFTEGVGLSNTRARLRHLYGEAHNFTLSLASNGGLAVNLELPFKNGGAGNEDSDVDN